MSADVVALPTLKHQASDSTITMLEEMLAHARAGDIVEIAAAVVWADGDTGTYASPSTQVSRLIGGLFISAHQLAERGSYDRPAVPPLSDEPA